MNIFIIFHTYVKFRSLENDHLDWELFSEETKPVVFEISSLSSDTVYALQKKIFDEVKNRNDSIFLDIRARDLYLWMVKDYKGDETDFLNITLSEENNGLKLLEENVGECLNENEPPKKQMIIHIIVDSPRLVEKREKENAIQERDGEITRLANQLTELGINNNAKTDENNEPIKEENLSKVVKLSDVSLEELFKSGYIKQGNTLIYEKQFRKYVDERTYNYDICKYECEIQKVFDTRRLLVIHANKKEENFDNLTAFEEWICSSWKIEATRNPYKYFFIKQNEDHKVNISYLREKYIKEHKMSNKIK